MSRCFPFPPPGYEKKSLPFEKKVQLADTVVSSKKKERPKHHEKKDKKDRREKKRRKDTYCNGDLQDKEKHGEAELVRVKPADLNSSDATQDLNHRWPPSSADSAQLKNGKFPEQGSAHCAQIIPGKAELCLKSKEVKGLVASKHVNNGQAGNHVNKHWVPSNEENRTFDNALKAEQFSKYKEDTILVASRDSINRQVEGYFDKHVVISKEQESAPAVVPPVEDGSCHPILKSVHKDQQVLDSERNLESKALDTNAELVVQKRVDSGLPSGSGKKKHSRFKGFLEFVSLPQPDDWTADCESWLSPMNHMRNDSGFTVEMQATGSQLSRDGPFPTNPACVGQGNNVELKGEDSQVWADAIFLPSVSIHALPYVVPY